MARSIRDEFTAGDDETTLPDVKCIGETDAAILCVVVGDEHWIPKSLVSDDSEVWQRGQSGKLVIKAWFARRELGL
jgi:hypothetical protein